MKQKKLNPREVEAVVVEAIKKNSDKFLSLYAKTQMPLVRVEQNQSEIRACFGRREAEYGARRLSQGSVAVGRETELVQWICKAFKANEERSDTIHFMVQNGDPRSKCISLWEADLDKGVVRPAPASKYSATEVLGAVCPPRIVWRNA